ncbi:MAG TPA: DNA-binding protein [Caulobacteraceae bacterium]|jgi:phosphoglycolate phosphatase-like HAD superfamily hydrolase|nr:DNA-binding protein [Caulobacteraceae bacterium]
MALFFDVAWFEARLAERGLARGALAAGAGMSEADLALVFKDQRELSAAEVTAFAELLGAVPAEIADRAGVSTPVPGAQSAEARLASLEARLAVVEAALARLTGHGA